MDIRQNYTRQIDWLLQGDPSIRYQTHRDLLDSDTDIIDRCRDRISLEGWAKQLLDLQDQSGTWGNGLYSPKWISTFYTLLSLKRFGMRPDKAVEKACFLILDGGFYSDRGINLAKSVEYSDTCVTGMFLSIFCHFEFEDPRIDELAGHLLDHQMDDGGWNCETCRGAVHGSFHTTISVLEGLREYEKRLSKVPRGITTAQKRGIEFLLLHRLFKSHRTGETVNEKMLRFSFPPRWKYDILRGLDYAREKGVERDARFKDAIEVVKAKQTREGYWKLQNRHTGRTYFEMETPGKPSRWNTLRALRILKWWD